LSNVIKAYSVRYNEGSTKTIDSLIQIKEIELRRSVLLKEFEMKRPQAMPEEQEQTQKQQMPESEDGFVEGLQAAVVETLPSSEEISKKTSEILENAENDAKTILEQARKEAEKMKADAYSEGKDMAMKMEYYSQRMKPGSLRQSIVRKSENFRRNTMIWHFPWNRRWLRLSHRW
jgi:cell division septum initiation protein DivIVA